MQTPQHPHETDVDWSLVAMLAMVLVSIAFIVGHLV